MSIFPQFVRLAACLTALLSASPAVQAAPSAEIKQDGTIVLGNSTRVLLSIGGGVQVTRDNGDKYEAFIPIQRKADGKSFHLYQLGDRKITVDALNKSATWRGIIPAGEQWPAIPVEISITARGEGIVRVMVKFDTATPIKNLLASKYMQFQSPRTQHAGQEIKVGDHTSVLSTDAASSAGGREIYGSKELRPTTFFPGNGDRQLTVAPVQAESMSLFDSNRPPQPTIHFRFFSENNSIIYDLGFSGEDKIASTETYFGVDYWAANKLRLPRYSLSRNLIQNPGFEGGFHAWQRGRRGLLTASKVDDLYEIVTEGAFAGQRALKIRGEKGQQAAPLSSFAIPVETGAEYTLSFYARSDRPGLGLNFSSVTMVWPVFLDKTFNLSTEWKRYDYTFKAPNEMFNVGFGLPAFAEDGTAWVDNVQLEKGKLTDFTTKSVGAVLATDGRGNWLKPGARVNARLELFGTPNTGGSATTKMTDFNGQTVREETKSFTLDAKGAARISLPWAEGLAPGLYILETNLQAGDFAGRDISRLFIAPFADGTAKHKELFAFGAESTGLGSWQRRLNFYKRAGIGSTVQFNPPPHGFLKDMADVGITNASAIFKDGHFSAGKHLKEDYHFTEAELKAAEEEAYQKAKEYPEIIYWKTTNEPGQKMMANLDEMREFVKPHLAAYRGIKRANPKAVVMSPDPSNMAPQSGGQFIDMFLQAGGAKTFDVVAIHPYRTRPEEPDLDADIATFLKMLDKHGYKGEVWFTEGMGNFFMHLPAWGIDTYKSLTQEGTGAGWRAGNLTYDLGWGEKAAAAYAMRYWLAGLKYSDRIKQYVSWYYFMNSTVDYDFTPGAEVFASNTLTHLLGNANFKQDIELGEGLRGYLFEDEQKRPVAAMWSHDIRVDKGDAKGSSLDISSLPANVELLSFTGAPITRDKELRINSFPVFVRGTPGSTAALSKTLAALPITSSTGRQLLPFVKVTGIGQAEVRLQNLLSRPSKGRVQISQNGKTLYDADISVAGKETWSNAVPIAVEAGKLTPQQVQVTFQAAGSDQKQVSELKLETLAIPRAVTPPTIDGKLSDWPAGTKVPLSRRIFDWGAKPVYGGAADLSATFYSAWDTENLYLAFDVTDDAFVRFDQSNLAWQGDSVQIYFDSFQNAGAATQPSFDSDDQNFDIWPGPDTVEVRRVVTPEVQLAFLKPGVVASVKAAFGRTDTGYILELAIPKGELAPLDFKAGAGFGFSFIISDRDNDGAGRKRGFTLTPEGSEPFNHPELFTVVVLDPKPAGATPVEAAPAAPAPTIQQTAKMAETPVERRAVEVKAGAGLTETDARLHSDGQGWKLNQANITDKTRPRVLLIGDSILSGYSSHVIAALEGKAYVDFWTQPYHHGHLQGANSAWIAMTKEVLAKGPYDVIVFNMGLHGYQKNRFPHDQYMPLTKKLVASLRNNMPGAKLIWLSTTPITEQDTRPEFWKLGPPPKPLGLHPEFNPIIIEHNRMAAQVMQEENVATIDLYNLLLPHLNWARGDLYHWNEKASALMGKTIAQEVQKVLPQKNEG